MKNFITNPAVPPCFNSLFCWIACVVLLLASCTRKSEPYSIIEFSGNVSVNNYSKSLFLMIFEPDSLQPTAVMGNNGDLFTLGDFVFLYDNRSETSSFSVRDDDSVLLVNDRIYAIAIPENEHLIPWLEQSSNLDLTQLRFIQFAQEIPDSYLPLLTKLSQTRPDAGLVFNGDCNQTTKLFEIFKPRVIAGLPLKYSHYDMLQKMADLEILMISPGDTLLTNSLPALPRLKQIFLTEIDKNVVITNQFLGNNPQIERVIVQKSGNFDFTILNPLKNLKELVVRECDSLLNFDQINQHKKLELLSVINDELHFDPALIRLPSLRWMSIPSGMTQPEFDAFTVSHPNLEMVEIYRNDTLENYGPLAGLSHLYGLTVMDTVMDVPTIKTLGNLKYLSLPADFLDDSVTRSDLQKALPDTRIVANEGFCLGSGWLMLLLPLILIIKLIDLSFRKRAQRKLQS